MYAVVKIGGHQYRVTKGTQLSVDFMDKKIGDKVTFENVLMAGEGQGCTIGSPFVKGATVSATVKEQKRDPKILVFKFRRRKNFRRKNGHRQPVTLVEIDNISI